MNRAARVPPVHPELSAAWRTIARAADKLVALESEALRLAPLIKCKQIGRAEATAVLVDVATTYGLGSTTHGHETVEHIISEGLAGRTAAKTANDGGHDDVIGVDIAHTFGDTSASLLVDRKLANWQGKIAAEAKAGHGLDSYRAALNWAKQDVPTDNALREKVKQELLESAKRHLSNGHDTAVLDAIYDDTFPEDRQQDADTSAGNNDLDAKTIKIDGSNEIVAEIKRLAKLPLLEYERERKPAAERLGIDRIGALDREVKSARAENSSAGGQGRSPSIVAAEPWADPVKLADVLDQAVATYLRYLILPPGGAELMALWSMGTHCFQEFPIFPRLAVTSPVKECAKSLLLRVLKRTTARPIIMTNANIAPLFRMISLHRPSIFLDEADNYLNDKPDLLALLNDGHAEGGRVWRCEGENNEVREFDVFAPVAVAMISRPPPTLLSRSLEIKMQRKKPGQATANFRGDRPDPVLIEIQRKFARAAADGAVALRSADPDMDGLLNRDADNWRPLFAIADLAGGPWLRRVRKLARDAVASKSDQSIGEQLLAGMLSAFQAKETDRLSSEDAIEYLTSLDEGPWAEWKGGKPLSKAGLARRLSTFGILSGTIRLDDGRTLKGYKRENFEEAFEQYLPAQSVTTSQSNNDGECDGLQNVTSESHVTLSKPSQSNNDGECDAVTDRRGMSGHWETEI
jgi:putative DNA primase/helicase